MSNPHGPFEILGTRAYVEAARRIRTGDLVRISNRGRVLPGRHPDDNIVGKARGDAHRGEPVEVWLNWFPWEARWQTLRRIA